MDGRTAIRVAGVRKRYRHFTLGPIDLDVPERRVLGLIGPNGGVIVALLIERRKTSFV